MPTYFTLDTGSTISQLHITKSKQFLWYMNWLSKLNPIWSNFNIFAICHRCVFITPVSHKAKSWLMYSFIVTNSQTSKLQFWNIMRLSHHKIFTAKDDWWKEKRDRRERSLKENLDYLPMLSLKPSLTLTRCYLISKNVLNQLRTRPLTPDNSNSNL